MAKKNDLYERELNRFRETLNLDTEVAQERYGMTLVHSLSPAERVMALRDMGEEITNAADYYNLGHMYAVEENWDEAITNFRKATELDSSMTDALYNLAYCFQMAGLAPQAKSAWQNYHDALTDADERAEVKEHIKSIG